jgi:hypothetical protein
MKKLQYTTNNPSATTDYLAADNTWKTIPGGGGGVPYTGATADVDLGTHSLTADTIGIGTPAGSEKLHIDGGASTTRVKIDADNGVSRILSFRTDDVQRWALRVDGTESGSNSGADFQLRRYNDAGSHIDNPIAINRSTGNITTAQNLNGATPTEMGYLSGVTSAIQTQLNSKIGASSQVLSFQIASTINASATTYLNTGVTTTTIENAATMIAPVAFTLSNMYTVHYTSTQPASGAQILTVRKNGVDTALSITIAAGSAPTTTPYSDLTNSVSFAVGDRMTIKRQNLATAAGGAVSGISLKLTI